MNGYQPKKKGDGTPPAPPTSGSNIHTPEQTVNVKIETAVLKDYEDIYRNGKFDIRVCKNFLNINLPISIWWDTMVAAQLLNEKELAKLKHQYKTYIYHTK